MYNGFWGDYHTHTKFSHGKGTIMQNALAAKEKGFNDVAITDHGFSHVAFGLKHHKMKRYIREIEEAKKETGINVILGIESNLVSLNGDIDVKQEYGFELIVCNFHKGIWAKSVRDFFKLQLPNIHLNFWNARPRKKQVILNTDALVKAIERNTIDIISHINYSFEVDCKEVAKACAHFGTLIEISGKKQPFNVEQFSEMFDTGVKFIFNSDAHKPHLIGNFSPCLDFLNEAGASLDLIENYGKKPQFASQRGVASKN